MQNPIFPVTDPNDKASKQKYERNAFILLLAMMTGLLLYDLYRLLLNENNSALQQTLILYIAIESAGIIYAAYRLVRRR